MRIVLFANNVLGLTAARFLRSTYADVCAVVVHSPERAKEADRIAREFPTVPVLCGANLASSEVINTLRQLNPELGLSVCFGHIFKRDVIDLFPLGILNLHTSLLPFNRGANPNVWSIVEGTPAGATLHFIDEGIDTGDILAQKEIEVRPCDDGQSLYFRLVDAAMELLRENWPPDLFRRTPQCGPTTYHKVGDLACIDSIDLERQYTARQLIDILRARTFDGYKGAYITVNGQRFYLKLTLTAESDLEDFSKLDLPIVCVD